MRSLRVDIACRVIDNYGDIGVSWRLARQLALEHRCAVRLWVDDVARLLKLCAAPADAGVCVRALTPDAPYDNPGDVLIEAFGCGLPEHWVDAMAAGAARRPLWIVLEYLSAEPWVSGHHGLPSPHPCHGLPRYFFFPGFVPGTGGVLCEQDLPARRDAFDALAWWRSLGMAPPPSDALTVSLFAYPHAPLEAWLDACARAPRDIRVLVPEGVFARARLSSWGRVTVHEFPFLPQREYDSLLWACDLNFVRGEDSFVRAQWAGKPFVWHVYAQRERAHESKLDAFLACCPAHGARDDFWRAWNGVAGAPDIGVAWHACLNALPVLREAAQAWPRTLAKPGDVAGNLLNFAEKLI